MFSSDMPIIGSIARKLDQNCLHFVVNLLFANRFASVSHVQV